MPAATPSAALTPASAPVALTLRSFTPGPGGLLLGKVTWPTQYPTNARLQWKQAGPVGNIQIWEVPEVVPATVANPLPAIIAPPVGNQLPKDRPYPGALPRVNPWSKTVYARVAASTGAKANSKPGTVVVGRPGQVTLPTRRPPGPGVKERKVRATGALAGVNAALGVAAGVYEDAKFYNDVLNAWYNALPGKKNARTPAEKAWELYRRWDEVNLSQAMVNVLLAVAGEKAGAYIDRARRTAGDNLGLNMYITIPTGSAPRI